MSNHLERFNDAYRAIGGFRDDQRKFTTDYGDGTVEHALSDGNRFASERRSIGLLTRILGEDGVPKEIRWNHIDLG